MRDAPLQYNIFKQEDRVKRDTDYAGTLVRRETKDYISRHYNFFYPDIIFKKGKGVYVYNTAGKRYIDATSGESFFNLGRNHPIILKAMMAEINQGIFSVCGCNFMHPQQSRLAKKLAHRMPKEFLWKVFFTNSGTESIEGGMKLAQYTTGKPGFAAFLGSFHGRTLGSLNLTNSNPLQRDGFFLGLPSYHITFGDIPSLQKLEKKLFLTNIAAIFIEPVQGYGGINVSPPGFLKAIREFCNRHNILMVVDEIQTGLGRTGTLWAFEHDGVIPDIVCIAKSLGSGLPLGAVIAKKEIMDAWNPGSHGSSGAGNPIACAMGIALLTLIDKNLLKYVRETGSWFIAELQRRLHPFLVTGRGFMVGIEFVDTEMREKIMQEAARQGLIMLKASRNFQNRSVRLIPPLNTSREVLEKIIDILEQSVNVAQS